jgi:hypothetical protein
MRGKEIESEGEGKSPRAYLFDDRKGMSRDLVRFERRSDRQTKDKRIAERRGRRGVQRQSIEQIRKSSCENLFVLSGQERRRSRRNRALNKNERSC